MTGGYYKKVILLSIIVILFLSVLLFFGCMRDGGLFKSQEEELETFEVKRGDIVKTVSTSGNVDSGSSNNYSLQASGKVIRCLEEGDHFEEGDALIEIDSGRLKLLLGQAEENINISKVSLDLARISYQQALDSNHIAVQLAETSKSQSELAAGEALKSLENANDMASKSIESARVALENSRELLEEAKDGPIIPIITDLQIEQYEQNVISAEAAYESAKSQARSQKSSAEGAYEQSLLNQSTTYWSNLSSITAAESQIAVASKNIQQAESQLRLAEINFELAELDETSYIIYAPYDGIVLSAGFKTGEFGTPGIPALEIASDEMVISSEVNETDMVNLKTGQDVLITLDAYYQKELNGKISEISPVPSNIGGVVSYNVIINPEPSEEVKLFIGLSAGLMITTESMEDILYVPLQSVYESDGKQYVNIVYEDSTIEAREIETGIFNYENIEVKSGLSEGDVVVVSGLE
jgi:HlyD family secretion protein